MLSSTISDGQFIRYQRQLAMPEILEVGQKKLLNSHVLIIGCGGLGSAAALYLCASGIGRLVIADGDRVDVSNLQRQVVYRECDVDRSKVAAMKSQLNKLNRDVEVRTISTNLSGEPLHLEVMLADIVIDCSDNMETRQTVNAVCQQSRTPLISGSAIGWKGQLITFNYDKDTPCYHCLYPVHQLPQKNRCSDAGVIGPVVGLIGNMQALQVIKLLTAAQSIKVGELTLFDGHTLTWQSLNVKRDDSCSVCAQPKQHLFDSEEPSL